MQPTKFEQQNHTHNEGKPNELPLFHDPISGAVVVCYEATPEELEQLNANGGKIYLTLGLMPGQPYPVLDVAPEVKFREVTEGEKSKLEETRKKAAVKAARDKRNPKRLKIQR